LLFRNKSVFLLILMGFVLFNLPDCISSRFQYNFWVKTVCGSFFLPILFPYQMVLVPFIINTVGVISGAGTANSSKFIASFWVHVARYLVFCVVFNKLWFVLLYFFFWLTASDYPFGIFKLFLNKIYIIRYVSFMLYKLNLKCPLDR
jgi:hypothetical protein